MEMEFGKIRDSKKVLCCTVTVDDPEKEVSGMNERSYIDTLNCFS